MTAPVDRDREELAAALIEHMARRVYDLGTDNEWRDWLRDSQVEEFREEAAALISGPLAPVLAAVRAVLAEHRPMANSPGRVPACPDCLGGIYADDPDEVRSCGCWGLSTPVCSSCCEQPSRRRYPLPWPCPTVAALSSALGAEGADRG